MKFTAGLARESMGWDGVMTKEFSPMDGDELAWLQAMEVSSLCSLPMALKAAIHLNVFHILANAAPSSHLSAEEIVSHIPSSNPNANASLDRLLCLLSSHSILSCSASPDANHATVRRYGLTPMCKYFVSSTGFSLAPLALMNQDKVCIEALHYLQNGILEGKKPFSEAHGKDTFSYVKEDLRFSKVFNVAMANHSALTMHALLEKYDGFEEVRSLVDVGGGFGSCLQQIVSKYPHMKGINFDEPSVVERAPKHPLVEHVGGDMFESVPKGDAIFMKWILHDWGDEHCLKILENCHKALEEKGKVIVVEAVMPAVPQTDILSRVQYTGDILMLACGGKERTEEEFENLGKGAGFQATKVVCNVNELHVIEFYK